MNAKNIEIAIVDDHAIFRHSIAEILTTHTHYKVTIEASNGNDFITQLLQLTPTKQPSIVIVDANMPGMDGFEVVHWLQKNRPFIKVIVLTLIQTQEAIIRMINLGVVAYLHKSIEAQELFEALKKVEKEGFYYNDYIPNNGALSSPAGVSNLWHALTDFERHIAMHLCTDLNYQQIANSTHVSPHQLDIIQKRILTRFRVKTRVSLHLLLARNKLVN